MTSEKDLKIGHDYVIQVVDHFEVVDGAVCTLDDLEEFPVMLLELHVKLVGEKDPYWIFAKEVVHNDDEPLYDGFFVIKGTIADIQEIPKKKAKLRK